MDVRRAHGDARWLAALAGGGVVAVLALTWPHATAPPPAGRAAALPAASPAARERAPEPLVPAPAAAGEPAELSGARGHQAWAPSSLAHEDAARRAEQRAPGEPRTEAEHHARFLELARTAGTAALEAAASDALAELQGERARAVAALRALADTAAPRRDELWMRAFTELPADDRPQGVSVPGFVLAALADGADHDAGARALLLGVVDGTHPAPSAALRRRAAAALARHASAAELHSLAAALAAEADALTLQGVAAALQGNPHAADAPPAFAGWLPEPEPAHEVDRGR